jgi:SAM-dependent methyltransferase
MNKALSKYHYSLDVFQDDREFHQLYPPTIQKRALRHWTPLQVSRCAAQFLVTAPGSRILDIGSGVGKFCLAAAYYQPGGMFFGIEQRKDLHEIALGIKSELQLENAFFMHGNFTQLDLADYDHFYFFNSFYENLDGSEKIDATIQYSSSLYYYYNRYLYKQLEQLPPGTRIATYHSLEDEIPPCYYVVKTHYDNLLKFWIKV